MSEHDNIGKNEAMNLHPAGNAMSPIYRFEIGSMLLAQRMISASKGVGHNTGVSGPEAVSIAISTAAAVVGGLALNRYGLDVVRSFSDFPTISSNPLNELRFRAFTSK